MMQCIDTHPNVLGECPLWDPLEGGLYWIDIESKHVHVRHMVSGKHQRWSMPSRPGSLALHGQGGLLIALSQELVHFSPGSGEIRPIEGTQITGPVRFNDGKCDAKGRFWVGTMDLNEESPLGKLYCLDAAGTFLEKAQDVIISNGLGWSPDQKTMYFTDSPKRTIYRYAFDLETGTLSDRQPFAQVPEGAGFPDGLCVDQAGYVWSAHFMGGCVTRYAPDGTIERVIPVPAKCPTSCCIGGQAGKTLFVTTATRDLSPETCLENPLNGGVFALEVEVRGESTVPFLKL